MFLLFLGNLQGIESHESQYTQQDRNQLNYPIPEKLKAPPITDKTAIVNTAAIVFTISFPP